LEAGHTVGQTCSCAGSIKPNIWIRKRAELDGAHCIVVTGWYVMMVWFSNPHQEQEVAMGAKTILVTATALAVCLFSLGCATPCLSENIDFSSPRTIRNAMQKLVERIPKNRQYAIAVVEFHDMGLEQRDSRAIEDLFANELVNIRRPNMKVIAQRRVEAIIEQLSFQSSDLFNNEKRRQLGKFLVADSLLYGRFKEIDGSTYLSLILIDVETAELIASYSNFNPGEIPSVLGQILRKAGGFSGQDAILVMDISEQRKLGDNDERPSERDIMEYEFQLLLDAARRALKLEFKILTSFHYKEILRQLGLSRNDLYERGSMLRIGKLTPANYVLAMIPSGKGFILQLIEMESTAITASAEVRDYPIHPALQSAPIQGFEFLREETSSCGGLMNVVKIYRHKRTGLEFVLVPGGTFWMGLKDSDLRWMNDLGYRSASPRHRVTVKPFLLCRTEVTNRMYRRFQPGHCMGGWGRGGDDNSWVELDGDNQPAHCSGWRDAQAFCEWAGDGLRLPSEAEWEYACRAGSETMFFWGDSESSAGQYANFHDRTAQHKFRMNRMVNTLDGHAGTAPVASLQPNAFGIYDMAGNVFEWWQDPWHDSYVGAPTDGSSWESGGSWGHVVRGGSFACRWVDLSGLRCRHAKGEAGIFVGIRPACSLE